MTIFARLCAIVFIFAPLLPLAADTVGYSDLVALSDDVSRWRSGVGVDVSPTSTAQQTAELAAL